MTSAVLAISMSPYVFTWIDAGDSAIAKPSIIAGGPPGVIEPAPPPPPPAPAANIPPPQRVCGTDLFTGTPIYC